MDSLAILCDSGCFKMLYRLTFLDSLQDFRYLVVTPGRNKYTDRLTNCLFSGIPVNHLGTMVPACDDALQVFSYYCVLRRLDNGGQG